MKRKTPRGRKPSPPAAPRHGAPAPRPPASDRRWNRAAAILLGAWAIVVGSISLFRHPTPLYSVESDTIGVYIPAARELRRGVLVPSHYESKGFGYPLLLAVAGPLAGGDDYLAARGLNIVSGVVGGASTYLLFKAFLGAEIGGFVLAGLLLNPIYARLAVEAGTDFPTFALLIAATLLLLYGRRPRSLAAAGLLAGYAAITRINSLFLVPAALWVLLRRPRPLAACGIYAAGLALPLAAWWIVAQRAGISMLGTGNVVNVAYEIYGRAMTPESFATTAGRQFHGFLDVVRYQPGTFVARIATNLGTRWLKDMRVLLPLWLAPFAVPGLVIGWWRRPGWPAVAIHLALCYATLSAIFYLARFELYLIPFYLSGAVALILGARWPWSAGARGEARRGRPWLLRPALLSILMLAGGLQAVADVHRGLATAPHETRIGGRILRDLARPGDRVMARKPNVAYFAGMDYVPLPDLDVLDYPALLRHAQATRTRFLFYSVAEKVSRPQFALLAYPGVSLPGLTQIAYRRLDGQSYCALYEFSPRPPDDSTLVDSVVSVLRGIAGRQPGVAWIRQQMGLHLLVRGRDREALNQLAVAEALDPRDQTTARLQIRAYQRLGRYEEEAEACERAIRIGSRTGEERASLGGARIQQRRWREAVTAFSDALDIDPGRLEYRYWRALARARAGDLDAARDDLDRVLRLRPGEARSRLLLARVLRQQGRASEALAALSHARPSDALEDRQVRALTDTLQGRRVGRPALSASTAPGRGPLRPAAVPAHFRCSTRRVVVLRPSERHTR